ncbi:hypothetical protein G5B39_13740 (plasmid) [Rhodobacteraceae bacterium SC52]|nr:hypothetical protein G5B39_13740 [Rhodobacteraceae bacterium SC52]
MNCETIVWVAKVIAAAIFGKPQQGKTVADMVPVNHLQIRLRETTFGCGFEFTSPAHVSYRAGKKEIDEVCINGF